MNLSTLLQPLVLASIAVSVAVTNVITYNVTNNATINEVQLVSECDDPGRKVRDDSYSTPIKTEYNNVVD